MVQFYILGATAALRVAKREERSPWRRDCMFGRALRRKAYRSLIAQVNGDSPIGSKTPAGVLSASRFTWIESL